MDMIRSLLLFFPLLMYLRQLNGVRLVLADELSATRYVVVRDVDGVEDEAASFLEQQETGGTGKKHRGAPSCR